MNFVYGKDGQCTKLDKSDLRKGGFYAVTDSEWIAFSAYCGDILGRINHTYFNLIGDINIDDRDLQDRQYCRYVVKNFVADLYSRFRENVYVEMPLAS